MRRLVWLTAGAVGGVIAYRKSVEAAEQAKARGMVGNVQALQQTTGSLAERGRALLEHVARAPEPAALEPLAPLPTVIPRTAPRARPIGA